jgi:hypothetical protein
MTVAHRFKWNEVAIHGEKAGQRFAVALCGWKADPRKKLERADKIALAGKSPYQRCKKCDSFYKKRTRK